jgi:ATP-dependent helicase Lhr and Lhr-like helicase
VDGLLDGVSCFLLGGRPWAVFQVVHDQRTVVVEPAPRGRQTTWGGYLPQFLGFHLCQKILDMVTSDESYPYLGKSVAGLVQEERRRMQRWVEPRLGGISGHDRAEATR